MFQSTLPLPPRHRAAEAPASRVLCSVCAERPVHFHFVDLSRCTGAGTDLNFLTHEDGLCRECRPAQVDPDSEGDALVAAYAAIHHIPAGEDLVRSLGAGYDDYLAGEAVRILCIGAQICQLQQEIDKLGAGCDDYQLLGRHRVCEDATDAIQRRRDEIAELEFELDPLS